MKKAILSSVVKTIITFFGSFPQFL